MRKEEKERLRQILILLEHIENLTGNLEIRKLTQAARIQLNELIQC